MIDRNVVYNKFGGRCAYSGTMLEDDWQVDHLLSKLQLGYFNYDGIDPDSIDNLMPCQKLINHYKRALWLDDFRTLWLGKLHEKIAKLPKCPRVEKSIRRKKYMLKIAQYFNITPDKPFSGIFYFESIGEQ